MIVQEPAFSFGAPGGASGVFSWATARSSENTGKRSKIRNAIDVAAPLTGFILTRTRCSPLPRYPALLSTTVPPTAYEGILHERAFPYHLENSLERSTSWDRWEDSQHKPLLLLWGAVTLGVVPALRREEDAWETVGGGWQ